LSALADVLTASKHRGFLGPGAVDDHIQHAAAFLAAVPTPPRRHLDLGSGGGVPGLVLAAAWVDTRCTLLDAQLRRVRFLEEAVEILDLGGRVDVVHGRAEDLAWDDGHRGDYEVVTARSFGPPAITAECGVGFLAAGGVLVVSEPPELDPTRWPVEGLAVLGLRDEGLVHGERAAVRVLRASAAPQARVPRRAAPMARRPRFGGPAAG
jgi:16S rRNA (guanine527-N7)-methyltransferase